jgi:hypothetical protein
MALVVNAFFAHGIFETNVFFVSTHAHFLMCMHIRGTKLYSAPAQHLVSVRSEQWFPPSIKVIHVFFTTYMWSFGVWTWFASEGSWCKSCNPEVDGQGPHAALSSTGGTPASEVGYPVVRLSMSVMRLKPLLNRKKTAAYGIPLEGDLDRWINSCNRCSIRIMTIITDQALCTFLLNLCA